MHMFKFSLSTTGGMNDNILFSNQNVTRTKTESMRPYIRFAFRCSGLKDHL